MTKYSLGLILVLLCVLSACNRHMSDRELFQQAVVAGKSANADTRWYIFSEIAKAEAKRGYYGDALQALKLTEEYPDQLYIDLVGIRSKNGDISGAKEMAESSTDPKVNSASLEAVAEVQARSGDVTGAKETMLPLPSFSQQKVLEAIGTYQAETGDLKGALNTASEMKRGWSDGVLFAVVEKLRKQGNKQRAHAIALRITDRDMAANAESDEASTSTPPTDACDLAWEDAKAGRLADAYKKIEGQNCACDSVAYIFYDQSGDAVEAERAMRTCPNPADVSTGMAQLAVRSAAKGDIASALKFADAVHVTGADFEEGYLAPALRDIARNWASKDRPAALKWAESKPNGYQRAMALLGVAEVGDAKQNASQ